MGEPEKIVTANSVKMTEKTLTELVKKSLIRGGWMVSHFHDSRRQVKPGVFVGDKAAKGFPDIVAIKETRLLIAELKSEKGKFRDGQIEWLNSFSKVGAEAFVWRPEHWYNSAIEKIVFSSQPLSQSTLRSGNYGLWEPQ
jgi:hypothetical protein